MGAFTGTLDWSVNNNNVTLTTAFSGTGTGTRAWKMGNGVWTWTGTGTVVDLSTITNLTLTAGSSTMVFTATTGSLRSFSVGAAGLTFNSISVSANTSGGPFFFNASAFTLTTLGITGPNAIEFSSAITYTINNFSIAATPSAPVFFESNNEINNYVISKASGTATMTGLAIRRGTFQGGATFVANNSMDLGLNTGITINAPGTGSAACILGGWLLWRDMPEHLNDNYPAWLDKAG
jgi:hypothetical protein